MFISSDATVHPRPFLGTYGVSKAGLEAFATTLALECEDFPIRSSIVRVGPTLTGFADDWDLEMFAEIIPHWQRFGIQRHFNTMQPDDVARAVVHARDRARAHVDADRRGAAAPADRVDRRALLDRGRRDRRADRAGERQRRGDEQEVVLAVGRAVGGEVVEVPVLALREAHVAEVDHVHGHEHVRVLARDRPRT